jgi:hypothetical protein
MFKMVDGTGIIGVDMICPLGVSTPQPPNYDRVELEGTGMLVLPNSLDAPLERFELGGKTEQVSTRGVNLFDVSKVVPNNNVIRNGDGSIKVIADESNNGFAANTPNTLKDYCPLLIVGQTYTLSANTAATTKQIYLKESGTVWTYGESVQITKEMLDSVVLFYSDTNKTSVISNIQIERGSTATAYEPYTGGKPSPSPEYQQEIKNSGKWNEETQKYEVDVKITNAEQNWSKEQTLTITSDRPLTKWDRLVEQGGQIGWLYKSKTATITGKEHYSAPSESYYSGTSTNMYTVDFGLFIKGGEYCNRLQRIDGIWDSSNTNNIGFATNASNQIHMRFFNSLLGVNDDATMQEKKAAYIAYLKKEYEKGTPYEIVYQSLEPEFIPLPQSEQNAIRALKTYYPTTVITADGGELDPDIKVTYRKEI